MIPAAVVAAGVFAVAAAGVCLVARGLAPTRPTLAEVRSHLARPRWPTDAAGLGWRVRLRAAALRVAGVGLGDPGRLHRDLAVTGRGVDRYALDKVILATVGACLPVVVTVVWAAAGVVAPVPIVLAAVAAGGVGGFVAPNVLVRSDAARRRRDARVTVSAYADLVCIQLAAGEGVATAVRVAAETGTGSLFNRFRDALDRAARRGHSPWQALEQVADELGIPELRDLTASITRAGATGAAVRNTLAAKAITLRDHAANAELAAAQTQSERLVAPVVLMMTGFLVLVGYPAVARVLTL
ncbi:MAG: type II secretion system F family protein [Actinobacteria bacterium]|nr:type II secretion system F family protein [Actinomycetota bacterium]